MAWGPAAAASGGGVKAAPASVGGPMTTSPDEIARINQKIKALGAAESTAPAAPSGSHSRSNAPASAPSAPASLNTPFWTAAPSSSAAAGGGPGGGAGAPGGGASDAPITIRFLQVGLLVFWRDPPWSDPPWRDSLGVISL